MRSADTTADASAVQLAIVRGMTPAERVARAFELSRLTRELALAAIRQRHPEYGDHEARLALFRHMVGDVLFRKAWPHAPLLSP